MSTPIWLKEIQKQYKGLISNAFMLTGNIGDYVFETTYLKDYLVNWLLDKDRPEHFNLDDVYVYDINTQGVSVRTNATLRLMPDPEQPTSSLISKMNSSDGRNAFIFYYPEYLIPAGDYTSQEHRREIVALHSVINSSNFVNSANVAFFITESTANIHPMFLGNNSRISLLNIELPDTERRQAFVESWYKAHPDFYDATRFVGVDFKVISNMTAGLQFISIEDILLEAASAGILTNEMILEKKKEIIRKEFGEVIEIFDTEGLSLSKFAGQETIKTYFKEVVIDAIKNNDMDIVPKGIMLMGPPGTGKTFFAKCLAADSGISFVEFKMSKILGKWVGESEKAMEKALSVFRALAPVGVFMDEIDQSFSRVEGGDDGGSRVNANLFGMLLAEMSKPSNRGRILWFAATNYPNLVDEALKRPGRFDKKIPFFAPTKAERISVLKMHLCSDEGLRPDTEIDYEELAERTDGYTQAEIEAIAVKARELAHRKRKDVLSQDLIETALSYMLSNQNDKIREMEDIALKECNDREFIPEEYRKRQSELLSRSNPNNSFSSIDRSGSTSQR